MGKGIKKELLFIFVNLFNYLEKELGLNPIKTKVEEFI